jgi:acetate kinase
MTACLVINAGSSSIKFALFYARLTQSVAGAVTEIGGAAELRVDGAAQRVEAPDHDAALGLILSALERRGVSPGTLTVAGHRVVHGGARLTAPVRITDWTEDEIEALNPLAPLHNPHNLLAIRALAARAPGLPQVACFDTAFHATNPEIATRYALPHNRAEGLRRYGFHGLSYAGLVAQLPALSGADLPRRILAFHLGNGASACAILDGASIASSMGYSPLDGLVMGTRAGALDPEVVLTLAERLGVAETRRMLSHDAGLKALAGRSDMRDAAGRSGRRGAVCGGVFLPLGGTQWRWADPDEERVIARATCYMCACRCGIDVHGVKDGVCT